MIEVEMNLKRDGSLKNENSFLICPLSCQSKSDFLLQNTNEDTTLNYLLGSQNEKSYTGFDVHEVE